MAAGVASNEDNRKRCRCPMCPSFNLNEKKLSCQKGGGGGLGIGKGCVCFTCRVFKENSLKRAYYCLTNG
jgi:hypothetical protein